MPYDPHCADPDSQSIASARLYIRENQGEGVECPCCRRLVKVYRRTITSAMAYKLIQFYEQTVIHLEAGGSREDFIKFTDILGGDFAKLRYWLLIDRPPKEERKDIASENGTREPGLWRLTPRGRAFVENRMAIEKYCFVIDGRCDGVGGKSIDIRDALRNKFNFDQLMGQRAIRSRGDTAFASEPEAVSQESFI